MLLVLPKTKPLPPCVTEIRCISLFFNKKKVCEVQNLSEISGFYGIYQNCQYPARYPDIRPDIRNPVSAGYPAGYPESGGETKS